MTTKQLHTQFVAEADQIEASAKESLPTWIVLGQSEKYLAAMEQARKLRHAATLRTPTERREYLK